jgi:hypothetical protein
MGDDEPATPDDVAGEAAPDENAVGEGLEPTEAFDLLGNDVRLGVIRELAAVRRTNWQWQGLTFADLRKAVGVEDAGNFSYHLDKLQGHFVVKDGDQYKLTYAGMQVAGAVVSGTYTERGGGLSGPVDVDCPTCGQALAAIYEHEFLALACEEHGVLFGTSLPPGAAEGRGFAEMVELGTMSARQDVERALSGACPHCWGPVRTTLPVETMTDATDGDRVEVPREQGWVEFDCGRCGMVFWLPPGACVLHEPAVVALYHEHGVDVRSLSYVELSFATPESGELVSEDPVRVRVDVEVGGDRLQVWLDGDAEVVDHERA